ncbi:hypothetical protein Pmani_010776 [Petrolisthes manimaculis]|uniref:Eukaryotic translation initiation factor 3 subunit J n=1 Tax=Petrolisthes manimaculis TaxID=1843537 RepID=A0AAE1UGY2_9EUCA|nr:hypothetical protein Pmani_010776 [Petrolisthes manimaculis]
MEDVSWDADDYEPPAAALQRQTDKWEGEDEEEEIKDNWDDEEEDKDKPATDTGTVPVKKKKKKLSDVIAEKEAKQLEALERKRKEAEEAANSETTEGKLEEKLRLQKIQEDADFQLATDLVGTGSSSVNEEEIKLLDIDLSTEEALQTFKKSLIAKIRSSDRLERKPFYLNFVEDLIRDLCINLDGEEVKRMSAVLNSLYNEKIRASKPKGKKKSGGKAKLNLGQGAIADDIGNDFGGYNEYDDFI